MSAKLKFFLILILSVFATAAGVYVIQHQPTALMTRTANGLQQGLSVEQESSELLAVPERSHYKTIPLKSINSVLQGSDPATLALNILDNVTSVQGKPQIEVVYPQPNQALVTITQVKQGQNNSVGAIKYRVEMNRFGRSLLVSSPPVWEVIWAGSQAQCFSRNPAQNKFSTNCN
ncbi:hypothetical protein A0J48_006190 [Sphaerospermopsis aphanizomenoides BCCUSP55]|uniref:hypothetical protein n=1 Tax=Sphaerospermopsis aphanizomenoides TaxID=459663 RepID=UPI00190846B1|nr:hypothetical protein [Sphaerospermopsis aphanizomenoides]MBK1987130.1 hypothetical protein [Sphaerospermopsis aphanizomenoides BCCUSP55]